jgi:hypothetical protein
VFSVKIQGEKVFRTQKKILQTVADSFYIKNKKTRIMIFVVESNMNGTVRKRSFPDRCSAEIYLASVRQVDPKAKLFDQELPDDCPHCRNERTDSES